MFIQLLKFEASYQIKQRAFILFSLLFLLLGFQMGTQGYRQGTTIYNSAQSISEITAIFTLGSVFIIMFFAISGVLRDKQYNTEGIIYSTTIKKPQFFFSRFLGVLFASVFVFSLFLVGFAISSLLPNLDPTRVAPFNILHYLWTWILIIVPNIFICTSIIFAVGMLTKNNTATYISAVLVYALYFISAIFLNSPIMTSAVPSSPESLAIASLLDPFGLSAMFEQTQYWTSFQKDRLLLSFSGHFMWNRIFWFGVSTVLLAITYKVFSFRKSQEKIKKVKIEKVAAVTKIDYKPTSIQMNGKSQRNAFLSLLKLELKSVFRSLPFIAIMIIWIVIVFTGIYFKISKGGPYSESLYPITDLLIRLIREPLPVLSILLIVFYSGELVWRERNLNFNGIIDTTPASNSVFFLSKFVALVLLPTILIITAILIAISLQISKDYYQFEIGKYLSIFYYQGIGLLFYCLLALFIQSIVRNKYLGMGIVGVIIIVFGTQVSGALGMEHPLLLIGNLPKLDYSNMNGLAGFTKEFNCLAVYWISFGIILSLLSFKLWQRGISSTKFRLKQLFSNWKPQYRIVFASFIVVFIVTGITIFYNTNIDAEYITSTDSMDYRENYERKFKKYETLENLFSVSMTTKVDLYPSESRYVVKAEYIMKNKSETVIDTVFITENIPLKSISLENATLIEHDTIIGTYLYTFKNGLQPNQELKFEYELEKEIKGFETDINIVDNGTYIMHRQFEPIFGYRSIIEIPNAIEREERGLPKRIDDLLSDPHQFTNDIKMGRVHFETTISTQQNQTVIAPGELLKEWTEDNRNYYHYKTPELVLPAIAYFSANYVVEKELYKGISIEQYYHPKHNYNIEKITESTKITLDYFTTNFGNYPFKHIRIVEIPSHWKFGGYAHPGTISMVEDKLYTIDLRDKNDFDVVAKRTIHEVAHQWWGHILAPKIIDGGSIFIEGLAKYSEAVLMERMYGKGAVWQLSKNANARYFNGRAHETEQEPPLYLVKGQGYLSYGKNYTIMLALKDLIGEEKINGVLKIILERHKGKQELEATSVEFLEEIYKVTTQEEHVLIDDWFKRVITYDLSVEDAKYEQLENGKYEISFTVNAKRFETTESGEAVSIDINELIQIGLFTEHPKSIKNNDEIIYLKPHQINKETMELKIIVDELPNYVSIDPFGTRSDENFVDNIIRF